MKKSFTVKSVVATAIGAALFFVLARFVSIPSGIPSTNISLQYAVQAVFACMYGPIPAALIGFIGHALTDFSFGSPWWSWIIASCISGLLLGTASKKLKISEGQFGKKDIIYFVVTVLVSQAVCWGIAAPLLDIMIYAEPANLVFTQGAFAAISNFISTSIVGSLLLAAYAATVGKNGSLDKD